MASRRNPRRPAVRTGPSSDSSSLPESEGARGCGRGAGGRLLRVVEHAGPGLRIRRPRPRSSRFSLAAVSTRAIVIPAAPAPITQTSASIRERSVYSRRSRINSRSRSGAPRGQTAVIPSRRGANPPGRPPDRPRSPVADDAPSESATRRRWRVSGRPARTAGGIPNRVRGETAQDIDGPPRRQTPCRERDRQSGGPRCRTRQDARAIRHSPRSTRPPPPKRHRRTAASAGRPRAQS